MKEIKLIILDFDGTLGDTADLIIRTMQATIKEPGLPSRTDKECGDMIGLRLIEIPPVLFPECGDISELYASTYRRLFHEFNTDGAVMLYPNVMETLLELKRRGKTLTIASSRSHASLAEYIEDLGLSDVISYILGANDVKEGKPDPEAIFKTLERFDFDTDEAIMIGDTVFDINMGINAGVKTCGVTYGNGSRESLSGADWIIDDFGSLLELIG